LILQVLILQILILQILILQILILQVLILQVLILQVLILQILILQILILHRSIWMGVATFPAEMQSAPGPPVVSLTSHSRIVICSSETARSWRPTGPQPRRLASR
jgi:hypothetical protein